jgi:hypothetical protein
VSVTAIAAIWAGGCTASPLTDDLATGDPSTSDPSTGNDTSTTKGADASVPDTGAATCTTVAPNNRCGLDPQCGCGSNETCDVTNEATGATSCVTAGGATLGRPCVQTGDCLAGLACIFGACRPYCTTASSKCSVPGTALCVEDQGEDDTPVPNKNFCTLTCDPRDPSAVCGTNTCEWFPDEYAPNTISDCNMPGPVLPYDGPDSCFTDDDCQPGFACGELPDYGYECESWCRIGMNSDCPNSPGNLKCVDVFGAKAPVIGGVKEGLCQ